MAVIAVDRRPSQWHTHVPGCKDIVGIWNSGRKHLQRQTLRNFEYSSIISFIKDTLILWSPSTGSTAKTELRRAQKRPYSVQWLHIIVDTKQCMLIDHWKAQNALTSAHRLWRGWKSTGPSTRGQQASGLWAPSARLRFRKYDLSFWYSHAGTESQNYFYAINDIPEHVQSSFSDPTNAVLQAGGCWHWHGCISRGVKEEADRCCWCRVFLDESRLAYSARKIVWRQICKVHVDGKDMCMLSAKCLGPDCSHIKFATAWISQVQIRFCTGVQ